MGRILVEGNKQVRCMRHFRSLQAASLGKEGREKQTRISLLHSDHAAAT